jgi:hypothetical protein
MWTARSCPPQGSSSRAWTSPTRASGDMRRCWSTLANTREVLYLVNRPGNAPSHTDAAGWIDKAIALVAPHAKRVCLRGDTDFALTANFDRWAQQVDFVLGTDSIAALRTRAEALPEKAWKRLARPARYETTTGTTRTWRHNRKREVVTERGYLNLRLNHEQVAEFTYRPGKCRRDYRVVVVRKNISRMRANTPSSTRSATSSTSPPTPPPPTPRRRSSNWQPTAATRRTSSASSSPAWARCVPPSTTWQATGPTCSSPHWPGTSSPGTP